MRIIDVREAIELVGMLQPDVVYDLLHAVFKDSKCLTGPWPSCGRCEACRFVSAVDEVLSTDSRDTDRSVCPPSSDPVDYADTVVTGLTLSPPSVPRVATLQVAFNLVADAEDWRNPIMTTLDEAVMAGAGVTIDDVKDAIEHYTTRRPSVIKLDADTWFVKSKGYNVESDE